MDALILRSYEPLQTRGNFIVYEGADILFMCKALELPDKKNAKNISCILEGEYWVEKTVRANGDPAFVIKDVPGRTDILIHIANFASGKKIDLQGCIAPGLRFEDMNHDGNLDIKDSTIAMKMLLNLLPSRFKLTIM